MLANSLERLTSIIHELDQQAKQLDKQNSQQKVLNQLSDNPLFSSNLFYFQGDRLSGYTQELLKRVKEIQKHLACNNKLVAHQLITNIEQQISALLNAFGANNIRLKSATFEQKQRQHWYNKNNKQASKYQQAVSAVLEPIQSLYQKLSEYHGFEQRLAVMIAEREQTRAQKGVSSAQLSQEILALHQRLGRCRKAITQVEQQIALAEKQR